MRASMVTDDTPGIPATVETNAVAGTHLERRCRVAPRRTKVAELELERRAVVGTVAGVVAGVVRGVVAGVVEHCGLKRRNRK